MENTAKNLQTVGQALEYCANRLGNSDAFYGHGTDNPWDEAVQLVLFVVDLPAGSGDGVLPHPIAKDGLTQLEALLERRINEHIPLPYLIGRAWFAGLEFHCDKRAIVPRSPIAELILHHFEPWYHGPQPERVLDLCCGGGCMGLATAHYHSESRVDLVDLDNDALELALENIQRMGLDERVSAFQSDLFTAVKGRYDIILSNPPYVNQGDLLSMPAEFHHEPELALGSGADGLLLTRKILSQAGEFLTEHGLLIVEVGNSWVELEALYPHVPFTWIEFENGGYGVFAISAKELQEYSESFTG